MGGRAVKVESRRDTCDLQNTAGVVLRVEGKMDHKMDLQTVCGGCGGARMLEVLSSEAEKNCDLGPSAAGVFSRPVAH